MIFNGKQALLKHTIPYLMRPLVYVSEDHYINMFTSRSILQPHLLLSCNNSILQNQYCSQERGVIWEQYKMGGLGKTRSMLSCTNLSSTTNSFLQQGCSYTKIQTGLIHIVAKDGNGYRCTTDDKILWNSSGRADYEPDSASGYFMAHSQINTAP